MPLQSISKEYIAIDPNYCCGKPRIAGTRMPVAAIAEMYLEMRESLEEIAKKYNLSLAAVHGAMAYYYEHRKELEFHNLETERIVEEMKGNTPPSKLQLVLQGAGLSPRFANTSQSEEGTPLRPASPRFANTSQSEG